MNLELISNSLVGGNIVAVVIRQLIAIKARQAAAAFRAKAYGLQQMGSELQYVEKDVCLATVPISVKTQESYAYNSDLTTHAIESGANLSDHIIQHPVRVDVQFEITNLDMLKALQANDMLVDLWKGRQLLDLPTTHSVMRDMVMVNYRADNTVPNWGALQCSATFMQVKFVTNETITLTTEKTAPTDRTSGPDASKSASNQVDTGKQTPQDVTQ